MNEKRNARNHIAQREDLSHANGVQCKKLELNNVINTLPHKCNAGLQCITKWRKCAHKPLQHRKRSINNRKSNVFLQNNFIIFQLWAIFVFGLRFGRAGRSLICWTSILQKCQKHHSFWWKLCLQNGKSTGLVRGKEGGKSVWNSKKNAKFQSNNLIATPGT